MSDGDGGFGCMDDFDDGMDMPMPLPADDGLASAAAETGDLALIAQPKKVEKISIDYAKNAKRVNVKQLKRSMWGELTTEAVRAWGNGGSGGLPCSGLGASSFLSLSLSLSLSLLSPTVSRPLV